MNNYKLYIYLLIIFITGLIFLQLYNYYFAIITENMDTNNIETEDEGYKEYYPDALILAKQNAGNIKVLKDKIDNIPEVKNQVDNMQNEINEINSQIEQLLEQQQDIAKNIVGGDEPYNISGTN